MSKPRRKNTKTNFFNKLSEGVKCGLQRLVNDNTEIVKIMLGAAKTADTTKLCELCAQVMQQQQLSPSSFLANYFNTTILAAHCSLVGKSGKGNAPALAERIAGAWLHLKKGDLDNDVTNTNVENDEEKKEEIGAEAEAGEDSYDSRPQKKAKTTNRRKYAYMPAQAIISGMLEVEYDESEDEETEEEHEDLEDYEDDDEDY